VATLPAVESIRYPGPDRRVGQGWWSIIVVAIGLLGVVAVGCAGHDGRDMVANGIGHSPAPTRPPGGGSDQEGDLASGLTVSEERARAATDPTVGSVVLEVASGVVGFQARYDVSYPQLDGLWPGDPVNVALRQPILAEIARFGDEVGRLEEELPDVGRTGGSSILTGGAVVHHLDNRVVSAVYDLNSVVAGAARPAELVSSALVDLATGRTLSIGDLFLPGSPWVETVAILAGRDLASQFGERVLWGTEGSDTSQVGGPGLIPEPRAFAVFGISATALVLRFERYQVGPGAMGTPTVRIPWSWLDGLVDPDGPAGSFVG